MLMVHAGMPLCGSFRLVHGVTFKMGTWGVLTGMSNNADDSRSMVPAVMAPHNEYESVRTRSFLYFAWNPTIIAFFGDFSQK